MCKETVVRINVGIYWVVASIEGNEAVREQWNIQDDPCAAMDGELLFVAMHKPSRIIVRHFDDDNYGDVSYTLESWMGTLTERLVEQYRGMVAAM